jgi:hypothetical protein
MITSNEPLHDTSYLDEQIHVLHQNGQAFISRKYYSQASQYYTAILQLLEENNNTTSHVQELKVKCLTSLSFCDFKTNQFYHTIARCTDIIDDFSSSDTNEKQFLKLLGKAYYRRGLAFYLLGLPNLAISDMKSAQDILPDDGKIGGKISQIYDENDDSDIDSNDNYEEMFNNIIVYSKNLTLHANKKLLPTEIEALLNIRRLGNDNSMSIPDSDTSTKDNFNGLGDISNLFNMKSPEKSSVNFSSIMNQVELFGPMIQKMTGIDSKALTNIIEIGKAIVNVYMLFNRVLKRIIKSSGFVVAFVWLLLSALRL